VTRRLFLVPLALGATAAVRADDIWDRRDPRYAYLFQDNRARRVGDLLTVVVSESTTANEREQRALDKNSQASGTGSFSGSTASGGGAGRTGSMGFSLSDAFRKQFSGNAQLTSDRTFTDRMAATVVDIMPNGNLVIEGYRSRVVSGEERVLRVSGVVRPADIGVGNAVPSASIANLKLSYLGRGPASRSLNQNVGGRVVNWLWPW
jgi:flagellar L-ring protein precursor FlgH